MENTCYKIIWKHWIEYVQLWKDMYIKGIADILGNKFSLSCLYDVTAAASSFSVA